MVIHADNGIFSAAVIVTDEDEYRRVSRPDHRPKRYFYVKNEYLEPFLQP